MGVAWRIAALVRVRRLLWIGRLLWIWLLRVCRLLWVCLPLLRICRPLRIRLLWVLRLRSGILRGLCRLLLRLVGCHALPLDGVEHPAVVFTTVDVCVDGHIMAWDEIV